MKKPHFIFAIIMFLNPMILFGHPHVIIDSKVTLIFDQKVPTSIEVKWSFDSSFSETVFQDLGKGVDGTYSKETNLAIKKGYFDNLLEYGYFTRLNWNGMLVKIKPIKDFSASIVEGRLSYLFRIPLGVGSGTKTKNIISMSFFDDTFFVEYLHMKKEDVAVVGQDSLDLKIELVDRKTPTKGWGTQIMQECRFSY